MFFFIGLIVRFPLRLVPANTSFNFIKYRWVAFALSLVISIVAVMGLMIKGLNYGVDFAGGVVIEIRTPSPIAAQELRDVMSNAGYPHSTIQELGSPSDYLIRFQPHEGEESMAVIAAMKQTLLNSLGDKVQFRKLDYVGPKVGAEMIDKAMIAVVFAVAGILIYIAFRFNWQFGLGAVISLVHDAIAVMGFYVFSGLEFDTSSIAAILTVLGYSINDTVVIYDRVRENLRKHNSKNFINILNLSINETLSRTVMTVMTVIIVCICLVMFGGEVIQGFSLSMLFGVVFGTYSSVYIAVPVLLYTKGKAKND